jgi:hypothetical protein
MLLRDYFKSLSRYNDERFHARMKGFKEEAFDVGDT